MTDEAESPKTDQEDSGQEAAAGGTGGGGIGGNEWEWGWGSIGVDDFESDE